MTIKKKPSTPRAKAAPSQALQALKQPDQGPVHPHSMSPELIEFITAIDDYKRRYHRPFPSWSEVLEIVKQLGYSRAS